MNTYPDDIAFPPNDNIHISRLSRLAEQLALRLARRPDDPALASLYDDILEKLYRAEAEAGVL
jgi:hypothetical protein